MDRDVMRLKEELAEADLRHQKMYLQMFLKGQQAARIQAEDDLVSFKVKVERDARRPGVYEN